MKREDRAGRDGGGTRAGEANDLGGRPQRPFPWVEVVNAVRGMLNVGTETPVVQEAGPGGLRSVSDSRRRIIATLP